jgi:hypothetical protein
MTIHLLESMIGAGAGPTAGPEETAGPEVVVGAGTEGGVANRHVVVTDPNNEYGEWT